MQEFDYDSDRANTMEVLEQSSHADLMRVIDYIQHVVMSPEATYEEKIETLQLVLAD